MCISCHGHQYTALLFELTLQELAAVAHLDEGLLLLDDVAVFLQLFQQFLVLLLLSVVTCSPRPSADVARARRRRVAHQHQAAVNAAARSAHQRAAAALGSR